ncbi:MAG: DUF1018 domain-containing protein [Nitrospiraceae bacterium]|nr:DUF1018 domain-containing protein [Nitrospiraceae bacterium]
MTPKQESLRKKKLALVHILKGQLIKAGDLDEKGYRDTLRRDYDVESSAELSIDQLEHFIRDLEAMGGVIKGKGQRVEGKGQKYESSLDGLRQEVEHLARHRFGEHYDRPLNALVARMRRDENNTATHWKFLDVGGLKNLRDALITLNKRGPYVKKHGAKGGEQKPGVYRSQDTSPREGVYRIPEDDRPDEGQEFHDDAINGGSYVW